MTTSFARGLDSSTLIFLQHIKVTRIVKTGDHYVRTIGSSAWRHTFTPFMRQRNAPTGKEKGRLSAGRPPDLARDLRSHHDGHRSLQSVDRIYGRKGLPGHRRKHAPGGRHVMAYPHNALRSARTGRFAKNRGGKRPSPPINTPHSSP